MPFAPLSPPLHNAVCRGSVEFWHDKASPVLCVSILVPASLSRRPRSAISLFSIPLPLRSRRCYSTRARSHTHARARAGHARFLRNVISTRSFAYYISCKYIYIYISILYANISRTQPWLEFLIIIRFFNCSNFNSNFRLPSDTLSLCLSLSLLKRQTFEEESREFRIHQSPIIIIIIIVTTSLFLNLDGERGVFYEVCTSFPSISSPRIYRESCTGRVIGRRAHSRNRLSRAVPMQPLTYNLFHVSFDVMHSIQ